MHLSQPGRREPTQAPPAEEATGASYWPMVSYVVFGLGILALAVSLLLAR
jgi:hypothetical protein